MSSETPCAGLELRDHIAYITLNNPPMNILTYAMMNELADIMEKLAQDGSVKAIAFVAEGKAFSAGADIGEHRPEQAGKMIEGFNRLFQLLDASEIPIVISVAGPALGAGFELAMMADVLLATEEATFGQPEIRLGFFAPVGLVRLPELIGTARAMEITCSGRIFSAAEMREYGLVTKVVPKEDLLQTQESVLKDFRRASAHVMRLNVRTLKKLRGQPFNTALSEAGRVFLDELMKSEDPLEGIASFYEKRRPVWKNR